jgi:hypothetical protein
MWVPWLTARRHRQAALAARRVPADMSLHWLVTAPLVSEREHPGGEVRLAPGTLLTYVDQTLQIHHDATGHLDINQHWLELPGGQVVRFHESWYESDTIGAEPLCVKAFPPTGLEPAPVRA